MAAQSNWSDLPVELLDMIFSSKLSSFLDILSIKLVCSSWRRVVTGIKNPKNLLQLVYLQALSSTDKRVCFVSMDSQKPYTLCKKTLPSFQRFKMYSKDPLIIGSHPDGWVILVEQGKDILIRNLISEISIPVPGKILFGITGLIGIVDNYSNMRAILSSNPCRHHDFVVVMILFGKRHQERFHQERYHNEICFWRNGDRVWTPLNLVESSSYTDIAFCKYTLYTLKEAKDFRTWVIETWDFGLSLPERKITVQLSRVRVGHYYRFYAEPTRLVVSLSGEIYIAIDRNWEFEWVIWKVDLGMKICVESKSLNGGALLYGDTGLLLVSSADVQRHGYKPDSIYSLDHNSYGYRDRSDDFAVRMYSLEDGETREIWSSSEHSLSWSSSSLHWCSSSLFCCWMDISNVYS